MIPRGEGFLVKEFTVSTDPCPNDVSCHEGEVAVFSAKRWDRIVMTLKWCDPTAS